MTAEEFFQIEPKFHLDQHGQPISWGLSQEVLRFIGSQCRDGSRTLETGAGVSTIVFLLHGCHHTAVTPAQDEAIKIRQFCQDNQIPLDHCRFVEERSEFALPQLDLGQLDLVLVDGRHAFPSPFIDWFYGSNALKRGGLIGIDDTQLETGRILKDFMSEDPCWRFVEEIGKTIFFSKEVEHLHVGEWTEQPYLTSRT